MYIEVPLNATQLPRLPNAVLAYQRYLPILRSTWMWPIRRQAGATHTRSQVMKLLIYLP